MLFFFGQKVCIFIEHRTPINSQLCYFSLVLTGVECFHDFVVPQNDIHKKLFKRAMPRLHILKKSLALTFQAHLLYPAFIFSSSTTDPCCFVKHLYSL